MPDGERARSTQMRGGREMGRGESKSLTDQQALQTLGFVVGVTGWGRTPRPFRRSSTPPSPQTRSTPPNRQTLPVRVRNAIN
eukprot:2024754-Rhodomonas_salina.2